MLCGCHPVSPPAVGFHDASGVLQRGSPEEAFQTPALRVFHTHRSAEESAPVGSSPGELAV